MRMQFVRYFSFVIVCGIAFAATVVAQQPTPTPTVQPTRERTIAPTKSEATGDAKSQSKSSSSEIAAPKNAKPSKGAKQTKPTDTAAAPLANRHEDPSEAEAAIVPYYNNYLASYHLGPEDVISIAVFNQPNYSKQNIIVPPDGRISYYLIPEGVLVVGKTTQQVQEELTKKLDEYIIDPKVTVSLDKAQSTRYSVVGDVVQPGVKLMSRRLSLTEAISEAGGILQTGDKKKVVILRKKADGNVQPLMVDYDAIVRGKHADDVFLVPGDQVIVPGNLLKKWQTLLGFAQVLSFARTFTPGF